MVTAQSNGSPATQSPLGLTRFSHASVECRNLAFTRRFLEEVLGLETVPRDEKSLWAGVKGNDHRILVIEVEKKARMPFANHNGLDVSTKEEVDTAREIIERDAEKWGIKGIAPAKFNHGSYTFYFWDGDENAWEILSNPDHGYNSYFEGNEIPEHDPAQS